MDASNAMAPTYKLQPKLKATDAVGFCQAEGGCPNNQAYVVLNWDGTKQTVCDKHMKPAKKDYIEHFCLC